jgi:hypothetical protein
LDNPVTFNEKLEHRKLFDRDPRLPAMSDKIEVKKCVAELLGPEWVVPTLWFGTKLPPRPERNWPVPYVLKASHASGWNIFVRSRADEKWDEIEKEIGHWLGTRYGAPSKEWAYANLEPRLLVEPFISEVYKSPTDYKLWVFDGKAVFMQVDTGRYERHRQYFYDLEWNRQPFEFVAPGTPEDVPPPQSLEKMIWAAERIGAGFSYARVDLYEVGGKPLFGEMTFYPVGARCRFKPESADTDLGRLWPAARTPDVKS